MYLKVNTKSSNGVWILSFRGFEGVRQVGDQEVDFVKVDGLVTVNAAEDELDPDFRYP